MTMAFSLFVFFAVYLYQTQAQVGGYNDITDATELQNVADLLSSVKSDFITLLTSNGCNTCTIDDTLTVTSAEYQVVNGYNYRAHVTIGDTSNAPEYDVSFYVAAAVNGTQQLPTNLAIIETTTTTESPTTTSDLMAGGFHPVTDTDQLQTVNDLLNDAKSDLVNLLTSDGCIDCSVDDTISVLSAYYQVVAGTNYRAHISIADSTKFHMYEYDVQFYVALPVNGTQQQASNLEILYAYTTTTDSPDTTSGIVVGDYRLITGLDDLQMVYDYLDGVKSDLVDLLNDNGCNNCGVDDPLTVWSAYYQVVAGYNYRAHIGLGGGNFYVQFYVPLGSGQNATDLQIFSWSATTTTTEPTTTTDRMVGGYRVITDTDDLQMVYDYLDEVKTDLVDLLNDNGCSDCSVDDTLAVVSAYYQVVSGYNYRAHITIGADSAEYDVQFYVPLPVNGVDQTATDLQLFSWTTTSEPTSTESGSVRGGWSDVDDLTTVQEILDEVRQKVINAVAEYGCDECTVNDTFSVYAAQSQVVAGTNYRVLLSIGDFPDSYAFKLQFFVPLPVDGVVQKAEDFEVLDSTLSDDAGYGDDEVTMSSASLMALTVTPAVALAVCCLIGCIVMVMCMKSKKRKDDKYTTLNDGGMELSRPYSVDNAV